MKNKVILISGIHRSGSTWLGKIISEQPKVKYVHEPFNFDYPKVKKPIDYWYHYIDDSTPKEKQKAIYDYITSFYLTDFRTIKANISRLPDFKSIIKFFIDYFKRINKPIILLKDPIALLSAEWVAKNFNSKVVISIRHPAAFVASIKVKNWEFDFSQLAAQEELLKTKLFDYADQINEYAINPPDIIIQGITIWNIIHDVISDYKNKFEGEWYFVKNEDLSTDPLNEYKKIFNYLDLEFTQKVQKEIIETTTSETTSKLKRNSKENINSWKKRLSSEEINKIKSDTSKVWNKFYSENDW
jgi:hypothetical protein